jgi:hypothetical protein
MPFSVLLEQDSWNAKLVDTVFFWVSGSMFGSAFGVSTLGGPLHRAGRRSAACAS